MAKNGGGNLVLSRRLQESIVLALPDGTSVRLDVVEVRKMNGKNPVVVLAIRAPKAVDIWRGELLQPDVLSEAGK